MTVFRVVAQCSVVEVYLRFRGDFPGGGGSRNLWNVGKLLQDYNATTQKTSSYSTPWEPEISLSKKKLLNWLPNYEYRVYLFFEQMGILYRMVHKKHNSSMKCETARRLNYRRVHDISMWVVALESLIAPALFHTFIQHCSFTITCLVTKCIQLGDHCICILSRPTYLSWRDVRSVCCYWREASRFLSNIHMRFYIQPLHRHSSTLWTLEFPKNSLLAFRTFKPRHSTRVFMGNIGAVWLTVKWKFILTTK
jgi:hypothetical protein